MKKGQTHLETKGKQEKKTKEIELVIIDLLNSQLRSLVRSPQREVVTKKLHNECRVLVRLLVQSIKLGDSLVESRLGQIASALLILENFIEADRVVEGETQADGVSGVQTLLGNVHRLAIVLRSLLVEALGDGELGKVAVVVTDHLQVEDLRLGGLGGAGQQLLLEQTQNLLADDGQLGLDATLVVGDEVLVLVVLDVQGAPRSTTGTDDVLVGNREEVALLDSEVGVVGMSPRNQLAHVLAHVIVALSLLSSRSQENQGTTSVLGVRSELLEVEGLISETRHDEWKDAF